MPSVLNVSKYFDHAHHASLQLCHSRRPFQFQQRRGPSSSMITPPAREYKHLIISSTSSNCMNIDDEWLLSGGGGGVGGGDESVHSPTLFFNHHNKNHHHHHHHHHRNHVVHPHDYCVREDDGRDDGVVLTTPTTTFKLAEKETTYAEYIQGSRNHLHNHHHPHSEAAGGTATTTTTNTTLRGGTGTTVTHAMESGKIFISHIEVIPTVHHSSGTTTDHPDMEWRSSASSSTSSSTSTSSTDDEDQEEEEEEEEEEVYMDGRVDRSFHNHPLLRKRRWKKRDDHYHDSEAAPRRSKTDDRDDDNPYDDADAADDFNSLDKSHGGDSREDPLLLREFVSTLQNDLITVLLRPTLRCVTLVALTGQTCVANMTRVAQNGVHYMDRLVDHSCAGGQPNPPPPPPPPAKMVRKHHCRKSARDREVVQTAVQMIHEEDDPMFLKEFVAFLRNDLLARLQLLPKTRAIRFVTATSQSLVAKTTRFVQGEIRYMDSLVDGMFDHHDDDPRKKKRTKQKQPNNKNNHNDRRILLRRRQSRAMMKQQQRTTRQTKRSGRCPG